MHLIKVDLPEPEGPTTATLAFAEMFKFRPLRAFVFSNLKINGKIVGEITSSTWSPYQVCGVGIVRMQNNNMGPGTVVDVNCTNGKIQKGELCELPMYDPNGDIVRGKNKEIPNKPNPWSGIKK